jgi:hypothetical protein
MDAPFTLTFETFWKWLTLHPSCIVRAGTPEAALYDDEDLHWIFAAEDASTLLVQLLRGKKLVGELFVEPESINHVEAVPSQRDDEHIFELIATGEQDRFVAYFFVLVHGFDEEAPPSTGRVH